LRFTAASTIERVVVIAEVGVVRKARRLGLNQLLLELLLLQKSISTFFFKLTLK
jgi:hypothetical protein